MRGRRLFVTGHAVAAALSRVRRSLGMRGLAALLLLGGGAWLYFAAIVPAGQRLAQARWRAASGAARPIAAAVPARLELDRFYARLPTENQLPDLLDQMFRVAQAQGLALDAADYQMLREPGARLVRCRISLPVQGSYPQLRAFLAALAGEVPALALENMRFEREQNGRPGLDANLSFVLFMVGTP